jgi:hypothetical protein
MAAPTAETVAPSSIAEVKAFLKAKATLDALKVKHPRAFAELLELAKPYNATCEAAAKVVRARRCSSGPFDLYTFRPKYDAEALYEAVGRQRFAQSGGVIEPKESRSIDTERFEALVACEKLPRDIVDKVLSYTPCFHTPDLISVPA